MEWNVNVNDDGGRKDSQEKLIHTHKIRKTKTKCTIKGEMCRRFPRFHVQIENRNQRRENKRNSLKKRKTF